MMKSFDEQSRFADVDNINGIKVSVIRLNLSDVEIPILNRNL